MKPNPKLILVLTILSLLAGFVFTGRGLFILGVSDAKPGDLALRWREVMYVQQGINPYDISDSSTGKRKDFPSPISHLASTRS